MEKHARGLSSIYYNRRERVCRLWVHSKNSFANQYEKFISSTSTCLHPPKLYSYKRNLLIARIIYSSHLLPKWAQKTEQHKKVIQHALSSQFSRGRSVYLAKERPSLFRNTQVKEGRSRQKRELRILLK